MKKIYFLTSLLIIPVSLFSQVCQDAGIGTNTPGSKLEIRGCTNLSNASALNVTDSNASSMFYILDNHHIGINTTSPRRTLSIGSLNQFLIDSVGNLVEIRAVPYSWPSSQGSANSLLSNDGSGNLSWSNSTAWLTTGNSGTVSGTNFIGTIDNVPLTIKVHNLLAGKIDNAKGNSLYGFEAGNGLTSGLNNTAVGMNALITASTYSSNTALGFDALNNNIANANTAVGDSALFGNTSGLRNSAIGAYALIKNTTGISNTAVGFDAAYNTTGSYNTAVGDSALFSGSGAAGARNTALGYLALATISTGTSNSGVGYKALSGNTTGLKNIAMGNSALSTNTTGSCNTAMGSGALANSTTGSFNTALGDSALVTNTIGTKNTAVGYHADVSTNGLTNATAIGYTATVSSSNSLVLGNGANVGIGVSSPTALLDIKDGHIKSEITTAPTDAVSVGNGITAAGLSSATDVKGTITTTGTNNGTNTSITLTFNKAYNSAPIVVITGANSTAQACTLYVTSSTTTFILFFKGGGTTPSFNYFVIE